MKAKTLPVMIFALTMLLSCDTLTPEQRSQRAAENKGDILIGVVRTSSYANFFLEGLGLAVEEINQRGGLSGRKIKTLEYDDKNDIGTGEDIASKLADNKDLIAVVGHRSSDVAMPASVIYEKTGIVFISYGANDPALTRYRGSFTFRNIPSQEIFGYQTAEFALRRGFKKTAVFYEREAAQKSLADVFKQRAAALGIKIVATRSYFNWEDNFRSVIALMKKEYEFDSVLIAGTLPTAGVLVKQLREMEVSVPIIGGDGMDSPDLWVIAGKAADNISVPTVFNPDYPDRLIREFAARFEARYGFAPDTWAAQGYDALSVLAHAMRKSGDAVPLLISTNLKFLEKWNGVTGSYGFTQQGDIVDKEIFFKAMKNGEFVFLDYERKDKSDLFNYIKDFTLRLPLKRDAVTVDPGLAEDAVSVDITEQLFMGLTDFDPKTYQAVPELAEEWKVNDEGDIYTFKLRKDAVWADGSPVTSDDVVWTLQRNISPDTKSPYSHLLYLLKNGEAIHQGKISDMSQLGVYAADDFTVVFQLEYPAAYFPMIVSTGVYRPVPKSLIAKYGERWTDIENIKGNGPYSLVLWEKGRGIFLKKNPKYYDEKKVLIPEIRYYVISQSSLGLAMYENDELDIMGSSYLRIPTEDIPRIKKNPVLKNQYSEYPHFCTYAYAFDTRRPPADNPLVRKAISAAIDRQLLIAVVNGGHGEVATTCTRPPAFGAVASSEGTGIAFDPQKAREWLAAAGYPDGKGFPEFTVMYSDSEFHKKVADTIRTLLEHHLNIMVALRPEKDETYMDALSQEKGPCMFRVKMCSDYPDADGWLNLFNPSRPLYDVGWENQEFAEILDKARKESDKEKRIGFYKRAEQILCGEDAVAVPLYFEIYHSLVKPRVKGWQHMPLGGQHIRSWQIEKE